MIHRKNLWWSLCLLLCLLTACTRPVQQPEEPVVQEQPSESAPPAAAVSEPEEPEKDVLPMEVEIRYAEEQPEPEESAETAELQAMVDAVCAEGNGSWDLYVEDLRTGACASARTSETPMVSASLIKLFVMGCVYEQIELGKLEHDGVYDLLYAMITVSDNYSANELTRMLGSGDEAAGMAMVNDWAAAQGCADTQMNRLMLVENGLQNYTTAVDCGRLLKQIYEGSCVNAVWSAEMLELLQAQTVCNRIPAGLPEGTVCGNKTGDLIGLCCADVAIVQTEQADYLLCAVCAPENDYLAAERIRTLSAEVYALLGQGA